MRFHFLHIGKTGGSAAKAALQPLGRADIVLHPHETTLAQLPIGERAVFAVRHPVARFVSGFYSRMRKGRPLYDSAWSPAEAAAFATYATPSLLAEQLYADDEEECVGARAAMAGIGHVQSFLSDWLGSAALFPTFADRIALILHQPELDADFERLKIVLDAPGAALPRDQVRRHANDPAFDTRLTPRAQEALERWYADDLRLYAACLDLRARLNARLDGSA